VQKLFHTFRPSWRGTSPVFSYLRPQVVTVTISEDYETDIPGMKVSCLQRHDAPFGKCFLKLYRTQTHKMRRDVGGRKASAIVRRANFAPVSAAACGLMPGLPCGLPHVALASPC
jgi:hypothetical protein